MRTALSVLGLYLASGLPARALADEPAPAPAGQAAAATTDDAPTERLDNAGKLGIGYQVALGGARGLSLRFGAGPLVISGMFAVRLMSPDDEAEGTRRGVEAALGLAVPIQRWDGTHFGLGLRAAIGAQRTRNHDDSYPHPYAKAFGLAFELPLYVEAWLSKRITMQVEMGVVFNVVGDRGSPLNERPAGLGLGVGAGGLFGSAAVHYYVF